MQLFLLRPVEIGTTHRSLGQERKVLLFSDEVTTMILLPVTLTLGLACNPALAEPFVLLIHEITAQIALRENASAVERAY